MNTYQFITLLPVVDLIKAGKLRALAVTGRRRIDVLEDVPTMVEVGFPRLYGRGLGGHLVKSGTPPAVVRR